MILRLEHVRIVPATASNGWAMDAAALEAAVEADAAAGLIPFYCVGTVGTTSSCAVDPLDRIGKVTRRQAAASTRLPGWDARYTGAMHNHLHLRLTTQGAPLIALYAAHSSAPALSTG
jgi:aromatic-L-amino-acid decarboxylase